MKICFYDFNLDHSHIRAIFGSMYHSFWKALEQEGAEVLLAKTTEMIDGDVMFVTLGGGQEPKVAKALSVFDGPVIIFIPAAHRWFYTSFLKRWKHKIIFAYGTDSSELTFEKYKSLGLPYYHIPFASDENIFKPLGLPKTHDILFVGNASSGVGRYRYTNLLIETAKRKNWDVLLIGTGWEKHGFESKILAHGELLNEAYNSAKICLNIHNDAQYLGEKIQMDANNRTFDLAMAGCFQLGNASGLVSKYFSSSEVITEDDPQRWIEKIEYYLQHENERKEAAEKARKTALAKHTWHARAEEFIEIINRHLYAKKNEKPAKGIIKKINRSLDKHVIPAYQFKEIRVIKFLRNKKTKK